MSDKKNNIIELADVIEGLRTEIEKAKKQGEGKSIRFGVNHIDVELNVSIMKQTEVSGGAKGKLDTGEGLFKFLVGELTAEVHIDGKYTYEKVSSQKITLNLSAKNPDGSNADMSDDM